MLNKLIYRIQIPFTAIVTSILKSLCFSTKWKGFLCTLNSMTGGRSKKYMTSPFLSPHVHMQSGLLRGYPGVQKHYSLCGFMGEGLSGQAAGSLVGYWSPSLSSYNMLGGQGGVLYMTGISHSDP